MSDGRGTLPPVVTEGGARVYLGLGSNLDDRAGLILAAVERLGMALGEVAVSPWYETAPVGLAEQPDFLNLVLRGRTQLAPRRLLDLALGIERALGRRREGPPLGPRRIDIDVLICGDTRLSEPGLDLPHPHLAERAFVLAPLRDLAPSLVPEASPGDRRTVETLWSALPSTERAGVRRIATPDAAPLPLLGTGATAIA